MDASLPELLRAAAAQYPRHPAVISAAAVLTFAEFDAQSDRVAAGLAGRGIAQGDRVGLYCPNSAEFAVAYAGILKAGAVVVPINLLYSPAEVAYMLGDAEAKGLIYYGAAQALADHLGVAVPSLSVFIAVDQRSGPDGWAALLSSDAPLPAPCFDTREDLAVILYTSGTTGHPKGAMLTHRNLAANTASVRAALDWRAGVDRVLLVLPMFHAFAATAGMLTPLLSGCAFVPLARFEPEAVAKTIAASQATIFLGVPSMYSVLLRLKDEWIASFAGLRLCVSGGAALPVEVLHSFVGRYGVPVYEGDGPTECSPVTCVNPLAGPVKPGTVGLPVPMVEMCILDEAQQPLPRGQVGEIAVRGPNVMKGYWRLPEATAESFHGDWFLTGDLGLEDEDGYFSIVDRKKDLIIVNGMNVYPRVIEEVLYALEGVREAAVVGEPHETHGEIPIAYVAVHDNSGLTAHDIRHWCKQRLGRHEIPRQVLLLPELP
ncbi:MAG: long-chain fatty acid--CoA ligase, partial [Methylococcaceae bacterium]